MMLVWGFTLLTTDQQGRSRGLQTFVYHTQELRDAAIEGLALLQDQHTISFKTKVRSNSEASPV